MLTEIPNSFETFTGQTDNGEVYTWSENLKNLLRVRLDIRSHTTIIFKVIHVFLVMRCKKKRPNYINSKYSSDTNSYEF